MGMRQRSVVATKAHQHMGPVNRRPGAMERRQRRERRDSPSNATSRSKSYSHSTR